MVGMPYPVGTVTNSEGHLEIAGCDVVDLAARFGTPSYLFSVPEMRNRARAYLDAFGAHTDEFEVLYASKALPVTAAYRLFASEGLSVDVASSLPLSMHSITSSFMRQSTFNTSTMELNSRKRWPDSRIQSWQVPISMDMRPLRGLSLPLWSWRRSSFKSPRTISAWRACFEREREYRSSQYT